MKNKDLDLLQYEHMLEEKGYKLIAGADEVGRGPLAGPVVTCACIMPLEPENIIDGVWDSKKLSEKKRNELFDKICEKAISFRIEFISEKLIDEINILNATKLCMANSINNLEVTPDIVLVDALDGLDVKVKTLPIIHGDALSYLIGCASILAKVTRDRFMEEQAKLYPNYGFEKHKGYGTKAHIEAIKEHGACPIHRKTFIKNFIEVSN